MQTCSELASSEIIHGQHLAQSLAQGEFLFHYLLGIHAIHPLPCFLLSQYCVDKIAPILALED